MLADINELLSRNWVQDMKVHLYEWDGKALKESGTLEGLKGAVSVVAIAPNGELLAAGDVSTFRLDLSVL